MKKYRQVLLTDSLQLHYSGMVAGRAQVVLTPVTQRVAETLARTAQYNGTKTVIAIRHWVAYQMKYKPGSTAPATPLFRNAATAPRCVPGYYPCFSLFGAQLNNSRPLCERLSSGRNGNAFLGRGLYVLGLVAKYAMTFPKSVWLLAGMSRMPTRLQETFSPQAELLHHNPKLNRNGSLPTLDNAFCSLFGKSTDLC